VAHDADDRWKYTLVPPLAPTVMGVPEVMLQAPFGQGMSLYSSSINGGPRLVRTKYCPGARPPEYDVVDSSMVRTNCPDAS
jgi:hypothetical protein